MLLPTGLAALGISNAGRLVKVVDLSGAEGRVINPNLRLILAGERGGTLRILDGADGSGIGASADIYTGSATFSADGALFAFSTARSVELWDGAEGRKLADLIAPTGSQDAPYLVFSPNNRYLAVRDNTALYLWDVRGRPAIVLALTGSADELFQGEFAISHDAGRIASTAQDGDTVYIWRIPGLNRIASRNPPPSVVRLAGHAGPVTDLDFAQDGTLASAGEDGVIRLWNGEDGQLIGALEGHSGAVTRIAFSRDGTLLVSAGADQTVRVWDVRALKALSVLQAELSPLAGAGFSADSHLLLVREGERIRAFGVYADPGAAATCEVVAQRDTNLRARPGVNFQRIEVLRAGERARADGQTIGVDGLSAWLRLGERGWVQAGVVFTPAECLNIPFIQRP